jgi:hypothetical protein
MVKKECCSKCGFPKDCIDKQNIHQFPKGPFLIKIPEASQEQLERWKVELSKLRKEPPIFLCNQNFELDTEWIKKEKVKEIIDLQIEEYRTDQNSEGYVEVLEEIKKRFDIDDK